MAKSKWQLEQDEQMDAYRLRLAARHARHARKRGDGNLAEGVRRLIEEDAEGFVERRRGSPDRRKK